MPTIFTRIVNGEIPCHKIAEDENYFAFLDINPLKEGHTLVVPKKPAGRSGGETDYIFDLDDQTLSGMMTFSKRVAAAIKKTIPCNRIGITVIGLEVPHAHIHLIPINSLHDMDFTRPKLKPSKEELEKTAEEIRGNL